MLWGVQQLDQAESLLEQIDRNGDMIRTKATCVSIRLKHELAARFLRCSHAGPAGPRRSRFDDSSVIGPPERRWGRFFGHAHGGKARGPMCGGS